MKNRLLAAKTYAFLPSASSTCPVCIARATIPRVFGVFALSFASLEAAKREGIGGSFDRLTSGFGLISSGSHVKRFSPIN